MPLHEDDAQRFAIDEIAGLYDVPPWLIDSSRPRPRFARLRWLLRRVWPI